MQFTVDSERFWMDLGLQTTLKIILKFSDRRSFKRLLLSERKNNAGEFSEMQNICRAWSHQRAFGDPPPEDRHFPPVHIDSVSEKSETKIVEEKETPTE